MKPLHAVRTFSQIFQANPCSEANCSQQLYGTVNGLRLWLDPHTEP